MMNSIADIPWREPWLACTEEMGVGAEKEIRREIKAPGHVLYGRETKAVGRRQDCDDFLFYVADTVPWWAVVHLTYNIEVLPDWPWTVRYESLDAWVEGCLNPDGDDWDMGEREN